MAMSASLVAGDVMTTTVLSNRIPIAMDPEITMKQEQNSPFIQLLEMTGRFKPCQTKKPEWMEDDDIQNTVTVTSAYTADGSAITMAADYKRCRLGDILYYPTTGEYWLVTTSGAMDSTVDVTPNWPTGSGGSAIPAGAELYVLGNAQAEWSSVRQLISTQPSAKYNYIQQFRNPFGVSGRLNATDLIGPAEFDLLDDRCYRSFMREREMAALFGTRGISGSTTTAGGLLYFMNQAGSDCEQRDLSGKALTVAEFNSFVSAAFTYASTGEKIALCGKNVMEIINGFAHEKLRVDMNVSKYGIRVMNYEASFGTLRLVYDKLFTELGMDDEMWVVDMPSITRRGLAGPRSVASLNTGPTGNGIQDNSQDGIIYEYSVEECIEFKTPERHARLYNVPTP